MGQGAGGGGLRAFAVLLAFHEGSQHGAYGRLIAFFPAGAKPSQHVAVQADGDALLGFGQQIIQTHAFGFGGVVLPIKSPER